MAKTHSKLSASGMYRWENCAASVRLSEGQPNVESEAAREGTHVHDLCEMVLLGKKNLHDITTNPQYREAVELYVDTITDDFVESRSKAPFQKYLHVEQQFDLSSSYPGCFGTADCVTWDEVSGLLRVYDFKFGKSPVDPVENTQLLYYALGALITLGFPAKEVEQIIVQPRSNTKSGRVRRWRYPAIDLFDFEERLAAAAKRTEDRSLRPVIGRYCYFCPAKKVCPAQQEILNEKALNAFDEVDDDFFA